MTSLEELKSLGGTGESSLGRMSGTSLGEQVGFGGEQVGPVWGDRWDLGEAGEARLGGRGGISVWGGRWDQFRGADWTGLRGAGGIWGQVGHRNRCDMGGQVIPGDRGDMGGQVGHRNRYDMGGTGEASLGREDGPSLG